MRKIEKAQGLGYGEVRPSYYKNDVLFDNWGLMTAKQVAELFGKAEKTIQNWASSGKLPCVKVGNRNMFLRQQIREWLSNQEVTRTPKTKRRYRRGDY